MTLRMDWPSKRLLVMADSDEAAVAAVRWGSGSTEVILPGAADPDSAPAAFDEIVVALRLSDLDALTRALASCHERLSDGGTVRLSLGRADAAESGGPAAEALAAAVSGFRLLGVEAADGVPYAVLTPGAGGVHDGYRLAGMLAGLRAASHRALDDRPAARDDLTGQLAASRAAETQLTDRVGRLTEKLDTVRGELRDVRRSHDRLSRSKLGRLTLGYWRLKRRSRRRGAAAAADRRQAWRFVFVALAIAGWLAATVVAAATLDWGWQRWLVVQAAAVVLVLLVLQVRGQRALAQELAALRRAVSKEGRAVADTAKGVAAARTRVDRLSRQLDTVAREVAELRAEGALQLTSTRAARAAVNDLAHHLALDAATGEPSARR